MGQKETGQVRVRIIDIGLRQTMGQYLEYPLKTALWGKPTS